ncbi:ATP-binding protein [Sphaerochaeta sp.]|uniref:ATP-binding protein n=1 Tax=Sphaerochaeta sp. TaxID=1972642 RepID=UPI003D0E5C24
MVGLFSKVLKKYVNPTLLILDEWLLTPLYDDETKLVCELVHKWRKRASTIFCSQLLDGGGYSRCWRRGKSPRTIFGQL